MSGRYVKYDIVKVREYCQTVFRKVVGSYEVGLGFTGFKNCW